LINKEFRRACVAFYWCPRVSPSYGVLELAPDVLGVSQKCNFMVSQKEEGKAGVGGLLLVYV